MPTAITQDIKVHVETQFQDAQSHPLEDEFLFAYRIQISNESDFAIQLMRRHWFIYDSTAELREVEGEGVIGEQPILQPGDSHAYMSACVLHSDMGKMKGHYTFRRLVDDEEFEVAIPEFTMIVPMRLS